MTKKGTILHDQPAYYGKITTNEEGEEGVWLYPIIYPTEFGFPRWSQRDPRWASVQLGFGSTTIGQYGCVVTSLAMAVTNIEDRKITPDQFNTAMKEVNGFSGPNQNLLHFDAVSRAYPTMQFVEMRSFRTDPAPVDDIARWLGDGQIVIVKVDMDLSDADVDQHWLLLVGGTAAKFKYHDSWPLPAEQDVFTMPPGYCKRGWSTARAIYAYARYGMPKG